MMVDFVLGFCSAIFVMLLLFPLLRKCAPGYFGQRVQPDASSKEMEMVIDDLQKKLIAKKFETDQKWLEIKQLQNDLEESSAHVHQMEADCAQLRAHIDSDHVKMKRLVDGCEQLVEKNRQKTAELAMAQQRLHELEAEINYKNIEIVAQQTRLDDFEQLYRRQLADNKQIRKQITAQTR